MKTRKLRPQIENALVCIELVLFVLVSGIEKIDVSSLSVLTLIVIIFVILMKWGQPNV